MFEVTEKATEKVTEFFKSRDAVSPLRIFVAGAGCSGPQLGMALDEVSDTDETFETGGFTYLVEKQLFNDAQPIKVDYITTPQGEGFIITSGLKSDGGCSTGSTGCGGGCCGC